MTRCIDHRRICRVSTLNDNDFTHVSGQQKKVLGRKNNSPIIVRRLTCGLHLGF